MAEGFQHPRRQLVGGELRGAALHHALFFGQLLIEQQRVDPVEACFAGHSGLLLLSSAPRSRGRDKLILGAATVRRKRGFRTKLCALLTSR